MTTNHAPTPTTDAEWTDERIAIRLDECIRAMLPPASDDEHAQFGRTIRIMRRAERRLLERAELLAVLRKAQMQLDYVIAAHRGGPPVFMDALCIVNDQARAALAKVQS